MSKVISVRGVKVEIFKTSFKIDGMSNVVWFQNHVNEEVVIELIEALYDGMLKRAKAEAIQKLADIAAQNVIKRLSEN